MSRRLRDRLKPERIVVAKIGDDWTEEEVAKLRKAGLSFTLMDVHPDRVVIHNGCSRSRLVEILGHNRFMRRFIRPEHAWD
jgi:hypothetical protein